MCTEEKRIKKRCYKGGKKKKQLLAEQNRECDSNYVKRNQPLGGEGECTHVMSPGMCKGTFIISAL